LKRGLVARCWLAIIYKAMGGHAAWRKRVEQGELAKGSGGAILRHRPRLGRKGKDLILNRKGHIGGGNPKKKRKTTKRNEDRETRGVENDSTITRWSVTTTTKRLRAVLQATAFVVATFMLALAAVALYKRKHMATL
jgi:hypothetical protein